MIFTDENELPEELMDLVHWAVSLLGENIRRQEGQALFERIESLRQQMKGVRDLRDADEQFAQLQSACDDLVPLSSDMLFKVAHAFGFMLELMNACENAYRTVQIRKKILPGEVKDNRKLIFVLTAHPTEARSANNLDIFRRITSYLIEALEGNRHVIADELDNAIAVGWQISLAKQRKPQVEDEAEHVFSLLFDSRILRTLLECGARDLPIEIRTWVGGDKDGHPGVNELVMLKCLTRSRRFVLGAVFAELQKLEKDFCSVNVSQKTQQQALVAAKKLKALFAKLRTVGTVKAGDGKRIENIRKHLVDLLQSYTDIFGTTSSSVIFLERLINLFPGLVVPIELRESCDVIAEAVASKKTIYPIRAMLRALKKVTDGGAVSWYAKSFVLSMVHTASDVLVAARLMKEEWGELKLPIVPLFENAKALTHANQILKTILQEPSIKKAISKNWDNRVEVMLGYSDSSKENGAFPSRLLIANALLGAQEIVASHGYRPLFFHGSGGSVERGGGSIQEQTEWWPAAAFDPYKVTVQGESIQRMLATPEVLHRQIERIAKHEIASARSVDSPEFSEILSRFSDGIEHHYKVAIHDPNFLKVIGEATPYRFVSALKIGSRPSARVADVSVESLRAIPWILCWTQTRVLFPTWWGVGSTWNTFESAEKESLRNAYQSSALLRSYIKQLGFTLAKVELAVWKMYLLRSGLSTETANDVFIRFYEEYQRAVSCVTFLMGCDNLLWFRPWLSQSVYLRSAMIHPINIVQIIALQRKDARLLRETVTGIASGMFATG